MIIVSKEYRSMEISGAHPANATFSPLRNSRPYFFGIITYSTHDYFLGLLYSTHHHPPIIPAIIRTGYFLRGSVALTVDMAYGRSGLKIRMLAEGRACRHEELV